MKRFQIFESAVPPAFEMLYHHTSFSDDGWIRTLATGMVLILQAVLIWFLLRERRRRGEAQASMKRQLELEALVSKASRDMATANYQELPKRLQNISHGLSSCLGTEHFRVWMHKSSDTDDAPTLGWSDSTISVDSTAFAHRLPFLNSKSLAGQTVVTHIHEYTLFASADFATLQEMGIVSFAMTPLKLAGNPMGAIIVGTSKQSTRWDREIISTLEVLANIIAQGFSRTLSEERVRRSEEQNRAMLASLPGFVVMIDRDGRILRKGNRLELDQEELPKPLTEASVGRNFLELWRSGGEAASLVAGALEAVITGRQPSFVIEYQYETVRGPRWMEVSAETLYGALRGAVVSQTDITRRKQTEIENVQTRQTAWHLNRVAAMGELTSSLAHEINQPLAAILSSAEAAIALLSQPNPDVGESIEALRDIIDDDKRAGSVIRRVRSMLKRDQETIQAVDLNTTIIDTLRLVNNQARLRHVRLSHQLSSDLPSVRADPTQLQQVILNLLTNGIEAVEYLPENRNVEIRTYLRGKDQTPCFEVSDSGSGISPDLTKKIFEPFYTSKKEGIGLGLAICRSIVDSFGGTISAGTASGGGALFRVSLKPASNAINQMQRMAGASF